MLPVIYYIFGYLVLLGLLFRCHHSILSKYLVLIWLGSSVLSLVFYYLTEDLLYNRIGFIPFVFIHLCFFVSIIPIIKSPLTREINISHVNIILYKRILYCFIFVSIVPFLENLLQVLTGANSSGNDLAEMYDSKMYGGGFQITWLSPVGKIGNTIDGVFLYFLIFSPFYLLTRKDVSISFILLSTIPVGTHLLFQMAAAGRGTMVSFMLWAFYLVLLFHKNIPRVRLKKIRIWGLSVLVLMVIGLTAITVSRKAATNAEDNVFVFIGYYVAKSHLDFNENLWHMKQHTEGDNSFAFVKSCLGLPTFNSFLEKEKYWNESRIGVQPGYFYTYIGDLYMDFGSYITVILFVMNSFFALLIFKNRRGSTSILRVFLFFIYSSVIIMGWSINIFKTYDATRNLILSVLLFYFIHLMSSSNNNELIQYTKNKI